ncbi:hypothetical protein P153DRAFT_376169 [Dothidotthia symphoricarpi CBS 119687]|uniref:Nudix hydrolase domain-containing protein n=1 Tax=Dothidotthia symphoricarpi CBS 119687 TaxID=1392245 RepID=A0A6A6AD36_9PLEO|nr:uncharacterized protein P153DRAFT_376169 [Dothidotthia symphoricarpi CBS 119687]KAF2128787.1 hypothetical protein P153DRAFT_376169 [Dothidotthia symphoricarpi CBS 119687]
MAAHSNTDLTAHLHTVLQDLHSTPYPTIPCPENLPKRASVALILRVQPTYTHPAPSPTTPTSQNPDAPDALRVFFEQSWVQHGDPEILFIKRASRVGDKWTGHVALPGGKRDKEDADDGETAVREAMEEVGIDLRSQEDGGKEVIAVGNLPQRIVTTSWGKVPLMVLCPYVYLLTSPSYPSQRLQPTEVASTHWVPIRALLAPSLRTHEYADVSARLAKSEYSIKRWFLQAMLSKMMFAAIHLMPSNSTHCAEIAGFIPPEHVAEKGRIVSNTRDMLVGGYKEVKPPLLLWGLTLGVVSDFLEHMPPHNALELWTYPTFTYWDIRFVMWAMSYSFRQQKSLELSSITTTHSSTTTTSNQDLPGMGSEGVGPLFGDEKPAGEVGIEGLGVGRGWGQSGRAKMVSRGAAVNSMLEGYYPIVRRAVFVTLVSRVSIVAILGVWSWRKYASSR